jgi:putative phage-type endonuclease
MITLKEKQNIVEKLRKIKLPEQRSDEWYKMRENMITASDFGSILGNSKYNSSKSVLKQKCGLGKKFTGNEYTRWGVKYEEVATEIYRIKNNTKVIEFGCLQHPKYNFLGASPDGITPDGMMLEIKVPKIRVFKENDVPPHYYDQMQGQLEVCGLYECDFLQCKIEEYPSQKSYLEDSNIEFKGAIIEYMDDNNELKFIYSKVNINEKDLNKWICGNKIKLNNKKLVCKNIDYWKLIKYCIDKVKRQDDWMEKSLPIFKDFWEKVLYYRENPDELNPKKKKLVLDI